MCFNLFNSGIVSAPRPGPISRIDWDLLGFIESNIYRVEDIKNTENYFLDDFPFNADEIFSYSQVVIREHVLFMDA